MNSFKTRILEIVKQIPLGRVTTYKQIAIALKNPNASRAVGNALNKNPIPIKIPCHRVVKSTGDIGGYVFGNKKKEILLKKEGINIKNGRIVNINNLNYKYREQQI
ncbi:MAG: MGMT family protein [Candidatus Aenigmarchaeota archaeon]|nr:MGMT family protein [Candidatus Aenigmarchaeota archaeon]